MFERGWRAGHIEAPLSRLATPSVSAWTDTGTGPRPYGGKAKGRWPFQINPDDMTRVYFPDPDTGAGTR
jgi:hypothetical protein